jgi:NADH-quinone oxidoreductase subunit M
LKKLVAYCTIQEMNLILLMLLLGDSSVAICAIVFSAAHAFLSSLMFFIVDCIYRRFHSRSVYSIQGLLHVTPNLGIIIVLMCVLYSGLPGTIKFSCEFFIFSTLMENSWLSCILLMFIVNVLGLIGFSKPWFNAIFGLPNTHMNNQVLDLS